MGASLTKAFELTSASKNKGKTLQLSPLNEQLLNEIASFLENLPGMSLEEKDYVFNEALQWNTSLVIDDFENNDVEIPSPKKNSEGNSLLELKDGIIKVQTFGHIKKLLRVTKENTKKEIKVCLESNPDPIIKILGSEFSTVSPDNSTVIRMVDKNENDKESSVKLRLMLIIQNLDMKLLNYCLNEISKNTRVTTEIAEQQIQLLIEFSGKEEETLLKHIVYTTDHVFSNGCRALPWRQLQGDICYVVVYPHDSEKFCVTAASYGWFVNKGYDETTREVNYEASSSVYRDLYSLLKDKSPVFVKNIDKHTEASAEDFKRSSVSLDSNSDAEINQEESLKKNTVELSEKGEVKQTTKNLSEPTLKWKETENLNVSSRSESKLSNTNPKNKSSAKTKSAFKDEPLVESDSSDESDDEEEVIIERKQDTGSDLPSEYWQIQKLVKYLKGGNQTATLISLCSMLDFDLQQETCQTAIRDVGGLEVLINLLDTDEVKCKIGALKILKQITKNVHIRRSVADLGGLEAMVKILRAKNKELKCLNAETISNVAKFKRARRTVRLNGGIQFLVDLLSFPENSKDVEMDMEVARCGALALLSCSKSSKNKRAMKRAGIIPLLAKLLKSENEAMLVPVVGTLQECASELSYRMAIRKEGMIPHLVKNLSSESNELQTYCAAAIFKAAEDKVARDMVRTYGGLDPLVKLLPKSDDKALLAAATGAIWKCAKSQENVLIFQELHAIEQLVQLMDEQPEEVLVNTAGSLAEFSKIPENRTTIRKSGGIPPIIRQLTQTNRQLLVNCNDAIAECAFDKDNMGIIDKLDGVRLIWSLFKNPHEDVQSSAAWAICPCIENAKDSGEMVRSFVGGLELIVSLLKSDNVEVQSSSCAAIAQIAKDEENLAVITDHGVVPLLARLATTKNDKLRRNLADAIGQCCNWENNRKSFGEHKSVNPLVGYLKSTSLDVHRSTAIALHQLSKFPGNCITMHESGVVQYLLKMVGSTDVPLQEAAASCISNIRRLALANEKHKYGGE